MSNIFVAIFLPILIVSASAITTLPQNLFDSEVVLVDSRSKCWDLGGYVSNERQNKSAQNTALKMKQVNTERVLYNFGAPFFGSADTTNLSSAAQNALKQGADLYFVYTDKNTSSWETELKNVTYCERILDYKCLQDVIISSMQDADRFQSWNCKKLHGSLMILGISGMNTFPFDFVGNIESIGGRLIIDSVRSAFNITFTSLVSVGNVGNKDASQPIIQISRNKLNGIRFPKLPFRSLGDGVRFNQNWDYETKRKPMKISFKEKELSITIGLSRVENTPIFQPFNVTEKHVSTEKDLKSHKVKREHANWFMDGWNTPRWAYLTLSAVAFASFIALGIFIFIRLRKKIYYNWELIESRDEQNVKENHEDYFNISKSTGSCSVGMN